MSHNMAEVVAGDSPMLINHLSKMCERLGHLKQHICDVLGLDLKYGVDILELKNQLLISYIVDLVHLVFKKCEGKCNGAVVVDRVVEIRTIIEKVRPLEQRFSYQLDKLLRTAATGFASRGEHPLQFKPNPEHLVSKVDDEHDAFGSEDVGKSQAGLYVPPRVVAVPFKQDSTSAVHKKVHLNKRLITELRDEVTDYPAEVETLDGRFKKKKLDEDRVKRSYEEEHLTRISSRQKLERTRQAQLDELSAFQGITRQEPGTAKKRKKRGTRRH